METTFRLEAIDILKKANKPLAVKEITKEILRRGNVKTRGATPHATLSVIIIDEIKKKGKQSAFIRTKEGLFALNKTSSKNK